MEAIAITVLMGLGFFMIYAVAHFLIIQNSKTWNDRSIYERIITVLAIVIICMVFI